MAVVQLCLNHRDISAELLGVLYENVREFINVLNEHVIKRKKVKFSL